MPLSPESRLKAAASPRPLPPKKHPSRSALPFERAQRVPYGKGGTLEGDLLGWHQKTEPPPIGVAGAGLGGCLAAIFLARRGEQVSVFEYRDDPRLMKAGSGRSINLTLTTRGLTALGKVPGLRETIERVGVRLNGRMVHNPGVPAQFVPYGPDPSLHYLLSVPRPELNRHLLDACDAEPNVTLRFNHKLLSVDLPPLPAVPDVQDSNSHTRMVFRRLGGTSVKRAPNVTVVRCSHGWSPVELRTQQRPPPKAGACCVSSLCSTCKL
jgi:hypothetical protein